MTSFSLDVTRFIEDSLNAIEAVAKDIIIEIGESVVTLTPVKTGRLKGNWQMTVGSPSMHSLIRYDFRGHETLEDINKGAMSFTAGQIAYIVNNLSYAGFIEDGGSRYKAPEGMVKPTMAKFNFIIGEAIKKYKI